VEFVKQTWTQARTRTALADSFHPIETCVRQPEFLRNFAMKLQAQLDLVALIQ
jgi:hypothetical protein